MIKAWAVLEAQAAFHTVLSRDDYKWSHESQDREVLLKFLRVPDLTVLLFEKLSTARICIDLYGHGSSDVFGWIRHLYLLKSEVCYSYI